jgi:nitrite reductase/ring-hydroxylating ferredoxin subunit
MNPLTDMEKPLKFDDFDPLSSKSRADPTAQSLCEASALQNGGMAMPFDVAYAGQTCRAFAVRFEGQVHAYLNRCTHVAMELDWQPNQVFDDTGQWLLCATHGAAYLPGSGECAGGPCKGGLVKIACSEIGNQVYWHTDWNLKTVSFDV